MAAEQDAQSEAAAWAELANPPTVDALQAFLADYPDGAHSEAANDQLAALRSAAEQERLRLERARSEAAAWAELPNPPTVDALQAFLADYPDGANSEVAKNQLAFLDAFPDNFNSKAAKKQLATLRWAAAGFPEPVPAAEQERLRLEAAWAQLPNPPTVDPIQAFLDIYADGANSEAAKRTGDNGQSADEQVAVNAAVPSRAPEHGLLRADPLLALTIPSRAPENGTTTALRLRFARMVIGTICGLLSALGCAFIPYPIGMVYSEPSEIAPIAPSLFLAGGVIFILNAAKRITWKSSAFILLVTYFAWLTAWSIVFWSQTLTAGSDLTLVISSGIAGYIGSFLLSLALATMLRGRSLGRSPNVAHSIPHVGGAWFVGSDRNYPRRHCPPYQAALPDLPARSLLALARLVCLNAHAGCQSRR